MSADPYQDGGAALWQALAGATPPFVHEPSAKVSGGQVAVGRYLISLPLRALGPRASAQVAAMLVTLGAPSQGAAPLVDVCGQADHLHLGHEPAAEGALRKLYLEFAPGAGPAPGLVFLSLKWSADGQFAQSLYHHRDGSSAEGQALIHAVLPQGLARAAFLDLMHQATDPTLLEVTEPGLPRRSLDLNVAESDWTVGDTHATLAEILGGGEDVVRYLAAHATDPLGHVALGTARDGRVFATLYHGARLVQGRDDL
jgi:hypothetical protein